MKTLALVRVFFVCTQCLQALIGINPETCGVTKKLNILKKNRVNIPSMPKTSITDRKKLSNCHYMISSISALVSHDMTIITFRGN